MVQEVFEPWQGMCADGRMRNGRAADGPRKEGSEVLEKKPEEPARNVTAGPCGPGLEEKCGDWVVGRDDGLPSPEPQLPRSSPSGSETGSSGSICVSDMNDTASQRVHEARQPEHHRGSDVQIQARAAQRNGKNASDEQAKGSEPVGQGAQGRGGARWLRSKQGTDRRRQNKCGNAASSGASAGSRVKPTAEQISLNKVLTSLDNPASVLDALVAASDAGQDINATNLTTGLHRIATRVGGKSRLLRNPRVGALLQATFNRLQDHPREFSERELATVAWAVGKLEVTVDPLLAEIRAECVRRGGSSFNWHDMSNIVWAHAVTPQRGEDWDTCMAMFVSEAETKSFDKCTPQALSNLAWALSTLGVPAKALLERFALHASSTDVGLDKFKPQEISSLAWGLSVGGVRTPSFFEAVEDAVVNQHLEGYNAQKISSLVCAFAEAGASGEQLFGMVEEVIMERAMAGFNPSNTATIAWAFARSGHSTEDVLSVVEERVWQLGMHGFDDSQLVLLVWALAAAKYHGPSGNNGKDTLSMVEVDLRRRKTKNMSDENLATLVWAFTKQGHSGGGGLLRVQKELMKRSWLEPQHEGKFSWSLTNRRMKQKDSKRPNKPPKPTMPDEMVCGLQQMGFASEIDVVLDGGCWAVDGSTNFPQEGGTDRRHLHEGELRQQRYSHVPEICRAAQNGEGCFQQYFEAEQSAAAGTEQSTWARPCGAR